jgi:hypothetical protein
MRLHNLHLGRLFYLLDFGRFFNFLAATHWRQDHWFMPDNGLRLFFGNDLFGLFDFGLFGELALPDFVLFCLLFHALDDLLLLGL